MTKKALTAAAKRLVCESESYVCDQAGFIEALELQGARAVSEAKAWLTIFRAILELARAGERDSNEGNLLAARQGGAERLARRSHQC
jgi:hypothetical protein